MADPVTPGANNIQTLNVVIPVVASFVSVIIGASLTYFFQRAFHRKELKEKQIANAQRASFAIGRQLNHAALIKRDFIDPHRDSPARTLAIQPTLPDDGDYNFTLDLNNLSFLLSTGHSQLLLDIDIAQQRYIEAFRIFKFRSSLHSNDVQPALDKAGMQERKPYTKEDFEKTLGTLLFRRLERSTDQMIDMIDSVVYVYEKLSKAMHREFKEIFPNEKFLVLQPPEQKKDG